MQVFQRGPRVLHSLRLKPCVSQVSAWSRIPPPSPFLLNVRNNSTSTSPSWTERLPIVIRPSFWRSMVPKPLRSKERQERAQSCSAREEWNPATYFILIFLLIGSNAIHFVNLKRTYAISSRQADNKIALLREVIRKVQAGEEVNVEAALGTGDPLAEQEWHDGMDWIATKCKLSF